MCTLRSMELLSHKSCSSPNLEINQLEWDSFGSPEVTLRIEVYQSKGEGTRVSLPLLSGYLPPGTCLSGPSTPTPALPGGLSQSLS